MSTAFRQIEYGTKHNFMVATGQAATKGKLAIFGSSDTTVQNGVSTSDTGIGIFMATAAADTQVDVLLFAPVMPVLVGTGGCTRGKKAIVASANDGFTDAPAHDSSGATDNIIYGIFMQSGSAGDTVGMMVAPSNRGSA